MTVHADDSPERSVAARPGRRPDDAVGHGATFYFTLNVKETP